VKRSIIAVVLIMSLATIASAGPVDEAKVSLEKERNDKLVEKSKKLLDRKATIEKELSTIEYDLSKLNEGKDVEINIPRECGGIVYLSTIGK
jgi:hypothetical protein